MRPKGKIKQKSGSPRVASKGAAKSTLGQMDSGELAVVLRSLLKKHPDLLSEAETIAAALLSSPSAENIAESVLDAVTSLYIDDINEIAGEHYGVYVDPSEAAWELLQEAIQPFGADMKRHQDLGNVEEAEAIATGIVVGLYRAKEIDSDGPLGWAPDFPAEEAGQIVVKLIRAHSPDKRSVVRDRILERLNALVPAWSQMLQRAASGVSAT